MRASYSCCSWFGLPTAEGCHQPVPASAPGNRPAPGRLGRPVSGLTGASPRRSREAPAGPPSAFWYVIPSGPPGTSAPVKLSTPPLLKSSGDIPL